MTDVAVVGCGVMGTRFARLVSAAEGARLTHVCDPDERRALRLAAQFGATPCVETAAIPATVEAAIVATPTATHCAVALELIGRGMDLLVEKPLGRTTVEAQRITEASREAGTVLAVGHVERHNPVVGRLGGIVDDLVHLSATRVGPYSRSTTDGVVLDLMIHDVDIVLSLVGSPVVDVCAVAQTTRSATEDLAVAVLRFATGQTADLTASRIGQHKVRRLDLTQRASLVSVDLLRQDIKVSRSAQNEYVGDDEISYRERSTIDIPIVGTRGEPLGRELDDFLSAVRGRCEPLVGGADGVRAVAMCERILDRLAGARSASPTR